MCMLSLAAFTLRQGRKHHPAQPPNHLTFTFTFAATCTHEVCPTNCSLSRGMSSNTLAISPLNPFAHFHSMHHSTVKAGTAITHKPGCLVVPSTLQLATHHAVLPPEGEHLHSTGKRGTTEADEHSSLRIRISRLKFLQLRQMMFFRPETKIRTI